MLNQSNILCKASLTCANNCQFGALIDLLQVDHCSLKGDFILPNCWTVYSHRNDGAQLTIVHASVYLSLLTADHPLFTRVDVLPTNSGAIRCNLQSAKNKRFLVHLLIAEPFTQGNYQERAFLRMLVLALIGLCRRP